MGIYNKHRQILIIKRILNKGTLSKNLGMGCLRHNEIKMKAIDFFCGVGGITYGLSQAKIDVLAGVDIDPICKNTYEHNNNSKFIKEDIHNLSFDRLVEETGIVPNDDSLIFVCCSPCQYWSKIRTSKKKSEATKDLLNEFQTFVDHFRPGYIIIENVPGLYKKRKMNILGDFLKYLDNIPYYYNDDILNASFYGVPQNRERYILIGTRLTTDIALPTKDNLQVTVKDAISDYSKFIPIQDGHKDPSPFMHTSAKLSELNRRRIDKTPKNGGTRSSWKNDPKLQLKAYRGKDNMFKDVYGRMYWNKPAPTITTRFNSLSNGRFGHPQQNRAISLREGATLQSFPEEYIFEGPNDASIARQIGNAVPPELARRIGIAIIKNFESLQLSN